MSRRTPEQARQALLDAAALQLQAQLDMPDMDRALSLLDLNVISRDAGYRGTSMIYSLWGESGDDEDAGDASARERFSRDVVTECVRRSLGMSNVAAILTAAIDEAPLDLRKTTRDVANRNFLDLVRDGDWAPWQTAYLWGITLAADPEVGNRVMELHGPSTLADLAEVYEGVFALLGRKLRPEVSHSDFAILFRALIHGLMVEYFAGSISLDDDFSWEDLPGWSLFAIGARVLLLGMSDPLPFKNGR